MAITKEKRVEIVRALEVNPKALAVARQIGGVSGPTVWKIAKQAGIELAKPGRPKVSPELRTEKAAEGPKGPLGLRVSAEKRTEVIDALKTNPNARHAARITGIGYSTILGIAKTEGIELRWYKVVTPEKRQQIVNAFNSNLHATLHEVAEKVGGITYETVRTIAKVEGIPRHRSMEATNQKRDKIIAALEENSNASAVARQLGVHQSSVAKTAKAAGIELTACKSASKVILQQRLSINREETIAALRINPNASQIARQLGVDRKRVADIAKAEGITLFTGQYFPRHTPGQGIAAEKREEVIAALSVSPNAPKVSRETDVSEATIRKIAREEGVKLPRGGPKRSNQDVVPPARRVKSPDVA